jgi:hypothetical protein
MQAPTRRAHDDRGSPVTYRDPLYHGSELNAAERRRIHWRLHSSRWSVIVPLLTLVSFLELARLSRSSLQTVVLLCAFVLMLPAFLWWRVMPRGRVALWARQWNVWYKELGRCPACQYSLASLEPATDGCTVCPECSGAWRLAK